MVLPAAHGWCGVLELAVGPRAVLWCVYPVVAAGDGLARLVGQDPAGYERELAGSQPVQ
ncbi:hypothetical protein [Frankia sp. KB5]|uniref:hypothetical protein n=1 Tax=Frankia sp. KB5 TaxID=683318 RepID=UPI001A7E1AA4|nr:hypothetical protein [Frankia sp. KB5]